MQIRLLDYANNECFVEIPDDTEEVVINIISGDMVMVSPRYFDTSNTRAISYFDKTVILERNQFHRLDEVKNSYEL